MNLIENKNDFYQKYICDIILIKDNKFVELHFRAFQNYLKLSTETIYKMESMRCKNQLHSNRQIDITNTRSLLCLGYVMSSVCFF